MGFSDSIQLKHPIVLIHGLGARSAYGPIDYFYGLPARLRNSGNNVFVPNLTAWHTIEHRAAELQRQIEAQYPNGEKVNLLGHSMGGLDARYLVSKLAFADRVASVTTVGTPHRGSTLSDIATGLLPGAAFSAVELVVSAMGSSVNGFSQFTTQYSSEVFSKEVPNAPGVAYFSAASAIPSPAMLYSLPIFWLSHKVLKTHEGDNDGFVSVDSAHWGEHICTYQGDHYAQIGQFLGRARGMNYLAFYEEIFARLRKEGM